MFDENRQILFNEALYKFGWKDMISERYGGKLLPHSRSAKELRIKSSHDNHLHLQGFKPNVIDMYLGRDLNEIVIKP